MLEEFVVPSGCVLTPTNFVAHGGAIGTATAEQLDAAFAIAEQLMQQEIGTFLEPTKFTGTYLWPQTAHTQLPVNRIRAIHSVVSLHGPDCDCDMTEITGCGVIVNGLAGIITLQECGNTVAAACCACNCGASGYPYQYRIVATAGIDTGIAAASHNMLRALTIVAQLELDDMINPHKLEGGPGDPGVQRWSDRGYSEDRTPLYDTAFGASALANKAARLVEGFKYRGCLTL